MSGTRFARVGASSVARIFPVAFSLAAFCVSLWGCSGQSRVLDDKKLEQMAAEDAVKFREEFRAGVHRLMDRVAKDLDEKGQGEIIDVLAISGGGDYGAFGTGFLVGWGSAPGQFQRPDFDAVTGVSTGALIAPFAYVGTPEAYAKVENFYRNPKSDWISMHEPFFFLPWNASFATIPGLHRDLTGVINHEFASEMATQSEQGKLLLVAASNLDLSRQRYWHLGPFAVEGVRTGDLAPLHKRLLASSAIPVVFPPVEIDGFLYADGGVTANLLVRLEPHSPDGFIQTWKKRFPNRKLPKVRFWVIINNWVHPPPGAVQQRWTEVMSPALAMSVRSGTMAELRWLAAEAMYVNSEFGADIEVRMVAIPSDWHPPVKGDFKPETMNSLADLGQRMGADPASWQLWCSKEMADTTQAEKTLLEDATR